MKWSDSGGGDFEPAPAGAHVAICVRVIDIGTRRKEFQGQVKTKREVVIGWELPGELMSEGDNAGKPFVVTKFYTQSLHEKATLRADLENWRGRPFTALELQGFDAKNILGKPCLVTVIHDKGKARVSSVTSVPKGMPIPKQTNPSVYFSLDEFDQAAFNALTDGMKRLITASPEYQQILSRAAGNGDVHDPEWKPGDEPVEEEDRIPF